MNRQPYWDSTEAEAHVYCQHSAQFQPAYYVDDKVIKLDISFDSRGDCDVFITDHLDGPTPGWLEANDYVRDTDDIDILTRIRSMIEYAQLDRPTPVSEATMDESEILARTFGPDEVDHPMPETTEEQLDALTTLVKLYMDKTDKHLKWHDGRAGGGFVYDHIHYDTDMGSGGVVR